MEPSPFLSRVSNSGTPMPTNIEIKARIRDWDGIDARAAAVSDSPPELLVQEDTFFLTPRGRLKLRVFRDGESPAATGQLIYYERPDAAGPKASRYRIFPTAAPEALAAVLGAALGVRGVVRKRRHLYLVGRTRIHLDRVEGLGDFLELEVVMGEGESPEVGEQQARGLMERLGVEEEDLVEGAYLDLLAAVPTAPARTTPTYFRTRNRP